MLISYVLALQSRWVEFCKEPPSQPTSRNVSTSPALCSDQTAAWCPTHLTSLSTWVPCKRLSSSRLGMVSRLCCHVSTQCKWQRVKFLRLLFALQIRSLGSKLKEGDVILSNHPCAGGSHLPDLTVITPVSVGYSYCVFSVLLSSLSHSLLFPSSHPQVFRKGVSGPVFFVASRGHHADIGGITPGSMPPHSTSLQQEGAVFTSFKLVTGGVFQEEGKRWGDEVRMNVRDRWKEAELHLIYKSR